MICFRKAGITYFLGVDEAGRGPIAGPVAVGVVLIRDGFPADFFDEIADSKQLTEPMRERWHKKASIARDAGLLNFDVAFASAEQIDEMGIVPAVARAMQEALFRLDFKPKKTCLFLDGSLKGPEHIAHVRIAVRGDMHEPLISLASIMAKVERDRLMERLSTQYPGYGFEVHKGYGTSEHYLALKRLGLSPLHRRSFIHLPL